MLEKLGLVAKKFIFPAVVIFAGLLLVLKGTSADPETNIMQTEGFLYGGLAILIMGVITLLYILEIINRVVHMILMVVLFGFTVVLAILTVNSVQNTIAQIELKETTDDFVKQGLSDIRDVQVSFKKKYGMYARTFPILENFLENDSIMDIMQSFGEGYLNMPEGAISQEHIKKLGYDPMKDDILIESYDEDEALKVGILVNDTVWYPVMGIIFTNKEALAKERAFMFEVENFRKVPMNDTATFIMMADTLDNGTNVFIIQDPVPFDPFNTKDTLTIGSMKESKNTGNWGE